MAKTIVLLSDGTGNAASSVWRTNVWRIFESLNLVADDQAAKYDDGVGTSSFIPLAIIGGAFGWGLKRNILDLYKFVCRNYQPDAKIFLFGFSRGAFTIRVLTALILQQGLVRGETEAELDLQAKKAYRAYRAHGYHSILRLEWPLRKLRDGIVSLIDRFHGRKPYDQASNVVVPTIEFVAVWDTVAAYGLPIDEMTRGVSDWIWPLELPNRTLSDRVVKARHALALDDERTTFHPILWTEENEPAPKPDAEGRFWIRDERLSQVWFMGMHSNVGGGYPDDALAYIPLYWMLSEASRQGLIFKNECFPVIRSSRDKDGRLYDSRSGLGSYYRYGPRKIEDLYDERFLLKAGNVVKIDAPKIHESVFGRIDAGCNAYGPLGIPAEYSVVTDDGEIVAPSPASIETPAQAKARVAQQERLWNYVWTRRIVYFMTVAASFHIGAFWLFHDLRPEHEFDNKIRLVSEAVRALESFLPGALHWWTDWYATNPEWFALGLIAIAALTMLGARLGSEIRDKERLIWLKRGRVSVVPESIWQNAIYAFRTNRAYEWMVRFAKLKLLPALSALVIVWLGATITSHLLFNVADSAGAFCTRTSESQRKNVNLGTDQYAEREFVTSDLCFATGLTVRAGYRYAVTVSLTSDWLDADIPAGPMGFRTSTRPFAQRAAMYLGIPLRRILFRPWYRLIGRVGQYGVDEYFLDPRRSKNDPNVFTDSFTANRDGEVFFYVNDAVVGLPLLSSFFYGNNKGTAKIAVKLL